MMACSAKWTTQIIPHPYHSAFSQCPPHPFTKFFSPTRLQTAVVHFTTVQPRSLLCLRQHRNCKNKNIFVLATNAHTYFLKAGLVGASPKEIRCLALRSNIGRRGAQKPSATALALGNLSLCPIATTGPTALASPDDELAAMPSAAAARWC